MKTKERTVNASEFKARCLKILDELDAQGIIITKRGRPVAKLTPVKTVNSERFYGCMKGKVTIKGDILSTGIKWNAQS